LALELTKTLTTSGAQVYAVSGNAAPDWPAGVQHLADVTGNLDALSSWLPGNYTPGIQHRQHYVETISLADGRGLPAGLPAERAGCRAPDPGCAAGIEAGRRGFGGAGEFGSGRKGMPFYGSIATAKGAVEGLAFALAPQQIRVNAVAPLLTDTLLAHALLSTPEKQEASAKRHLLGRYGQPQ
jgi:3-oxoacyl-[acyl-carrier protein] reductase